MLIDMIAILDLVLNGSDTLSRMLNNVSRIFASDTQRRVYWQEATALLAGSRVLTIISQVFATIKDLGEMQADMHG